MFRFVIISRNEDKTLYEVRKYLSIFGLFYLPFGKVSVMCTESIVNLITFGVKFTIFSEGNNTKIYTYLTKNGEFIRSSGNNKSGDNISNLPVKELYI